MADNLDPVALARERLVLEALNLASCRQQAQVQPDDNGDEYFDFCIEQLDIAACELAKALEES